jgi:hypothetical protein
MKGMFQQKEFEVLFKLIKTFLEVYVICDHVVQTDSRIYHDFAKKNCIAMYM